MAVKSTFRPIRRSDGPCGLMAVTFCALSYYGEEPASEAGIPPRPRPPVEKPFFAATAFGFTCYILAQQSANSDHFGQVYASWERGSVTAVPIQTRGRAQRKEPKQAHRSERKGSEHGGVPHRPYCGERPAEVGLSTLAVGLRAVTGRDRFSGSAGQAAGVDPPPRPVARGRDN